MKGITYCGECSDYSYEKHCCKRGAKSEIDPKNKFYDDCPLPDVTVPGTHWIDGATQPTKSGEYFVILEAKQDGEPLSSGKILFKKGDIEITSDWYSADRATFDMVGMDNPVWRVRSWAKIQMPVIPENVRERVRWYFGEEVKHDET